MENDNIVVKNGIVIKQQLKEIMKLDYLRHEVAKGAEQAERGEFSKHTIDTLLEELNTQEQTA